MDINIGSPETQEAITRDDNSNNKYLHLHITSHTQDGMAFAASSATEEEQRLAKLGRQPDGSTAVKVAKRPWRPKVKFQYEEPEEELDTSDDLDWMHEECGHALAAKNTKLPPKKRSDQIQRTTRQEGATRKCAMARLPTMDQAHHGRHHKNVLGLFH